MAVFPSVTLLDNFNRADVGPPPSASWTTAFGTTGLKVLSNQLAAGAAGFQLSYWNAATFGADVHVTFDLPTIANGKAFESWLFHGLSPTNGYLISFYGPSTLSIDKFVAGVQSSIGSSTATTFASGDSIGWSIEGSTITIYRLPSGSSTWASALSVTDSTFAGTTGRNLGFTLQDTTNRIDNVSAANVTAGALATPFPGATTLDDFTRANTGPPPGPRWATPPATSAGSLPISGNGLQVISNVVANAGTTWANADWDTQFGPGLVVFATISTIGANGTWAGLSTVIPNTDSRYTTELTFDTVGGHALRVYKYAAGERVRLDSGSVVSGWAAGDGLALEVKDDKVNTWRRAGLTGTWAIVQTTTDSAFQPGVKAARIQLLGTTPRLDDFGAATVSSTPQVPATFTDTPGNLVAVPVEIGTTLFAIYRGSTGSPYTVRSDKYTGADVTGPAAAVVSVTSTTTTSVSIEAIMPADPDTIAYEIRTLNGATPPGLSQSNGTIVQAETATTPGATITKTISGLTAGQQISGRVFVKDTSGNWNNGATATFTAIAASVPAFVSRYRSDGTTVVADATTAGGPGVILEYQLDPANMITGGANVHLRFITGTDNATPPTTSIETIFSRTTPTRFKYQDSGGTWQVYPTGGLPSADWGRKVRVLTSPLASGTLYGSLRIEQLN